MKFEYLPLQALAEEIRNEIFPLFDTDPYSLISPSAYDTAWLAMVEDDREQASRPMFQGCLDWILNNQNDDGFWGNCDGHGTPTIDTLTATLACLVALNKWNMGTFHVHKGISYLERKTERLLANYTNDGSCPRWFAITFPGMLELAQQVGLEFVFTSSCRRQISDIFYQRHKILSREKLVEDDLYPLLAYLEALPSTYAMNQEDIIQRLEIDGSLFQSPSATAAAFMFTKNKHFLAYLQSLVQRCPQGVPQTYPLNEELIKLSLVNLIENLGLADYFDKEIEQDLYQIYKNYEIEEPDKMPISLVGEQLHKNSLEFRMLRMHGHVVSPRKFCWFLNDEGVQDHLERNQEYVSGAMLSVHRATDLMFQGEYELEDARKFSKTLLEKNRFNEQMIKHELSTPWMARLEHLEHRMWIEEKNSNALWLGKASFHRLHDQYTKKLTLLASTNFEFRQSTYRCELDELRMWAKEWGLSEMGFGREKTTYCYFATAASTSLPHESAFRKIAAKISILITVADDFFDMKGSLDELEALTNAVLRWKAEELEGHSKTIFRALDSLVGEIAEICLKQNETDITDTLRDMWGETFVSWLREAEWSKKGYTPSMDEYLQNGMVSIATHVLLLSASCLLHPTLPEDKLKPQNRETLTRLLMIIPRLLNDLQSYEKEKEQGKINSVLLHMRKNSNAEIEDSIVYIEQIIDGKRKEFLEHALGNEFSGLPKQCKELHLSCCRVFEMFFNKKNRYDSDIDMLQDIKKGLYDPITVHKHMQPLDNGEPLTLIPPLPLPLIQPPHSEPDKKKYPVIKSRLFLRQHYNIGKPVNAFRLAYHKPLKVIAYKNVSVPAKFPVCFS